MIRYLKNPQIDRSQWDAAVHEASNGLIYAYSWYLDIVTPGWEALVEDDYASFMPLPAKRKFLLNYLIQPRFTQQLGIFSKKDISEEMVLRFIAAVPLKFVWRDFNLNYANTVASGKRFVLRNNCELNLNKDYQKIYEGFNENTRRNLSKAKNAKNFLEEISQPDDFLERYELHARVKPDAITGFQLKNIIETAIRNNMGELIVTRDEQGHMTAGAFFLITEKRIIYLTSFTTELGMDLSAMFLIINHMIVKNANKPVQFDFEGSMINGIARFFKGFGSAEKPYPRYIFRPFADLLTRK